MEMDPFFAVTDNAEPTSQSVPKSSLPSKANETISSTIESNTPSGDSTIPSTTTNSTSTTSAEAAGIDPNDKISLANYEISNLLQQNKISQKDVNTFQAILRENVALKGKTQKLKNLLGRSAKAQSDLKQEVNTSKWKLDQAHKAIDKLNARMEQLANQPTHMDILADFEANFDRALLSMGGVPQEEDPYEDYDPNQMNAARFDSSALMVGPYQSGGEDPSSSTTTLDITNNDYSTNTDIGRLHHDASSSSNDIQALLVELETKHEQMKHQESLNSTLLAQSSKLETQVETQSHQIQSLQSKNDNLTLELRMSKNETARIQKKVKERSMALTEMQMEIDLVTKASVQANARASESMEVVKNIKTDKKHVDELEAKVDALQEWALASAEAKRLTVERANELEKKLRHYYEMFEKEEDGIPSVSPTIRGGGSGSTEGRKLWTKSSSKVVGAGMDITFVVPLGDCVLSPNEMVVLRWKFDIIPGELDIDFSIMKGKYDQSKKRDGADYLIKQRVVVGGAGGEVSGAFAVQNACTLLWSNKRSWVRPRAVKFSCEAYAINI